MIVRGQQLCAYAHYLLTLITLGSLIDPVRTTEQAGVESVDWGDLAPFLSEAIKAEPGLPGDPAAAVLGDAAVAVARAAGFLSRRYDLVITNVPYLSRAKQTDVLRSFVEREYPNARNDLAMAMSRRCFDLARSFACVMPQSWLSLSSYEDYRRSVLTDQRLHAVVRLGAGAFQSISGVVVNVVLLLSTRESENDSVFFALDLDAIEGIEAKRSLLATGSLTLLSQRAQLRNPDNRILLQAASSHLPILAVLASSYTGTQTGDFARFGRCYWEFPGIPGNWAPQMSTVRASVPWGGREHIIHWEGGKGDLVAHHGSYVRGRAAWGKRGILVSRMGDLPVTLYSGEFFDDNAAVIVPKDENELPAIWQFCVSPEFARAVRSLDTSIKVTNGTLVKVPFDMARWRRVAADAGPLPEPYSDDPTQWLFKGVPAESTDPLQVAVARLVGFRWPDQKPDSIDELVDLDGIVCLPAVAGERSAADRVREVLARAYGDTWSGPVLGELLTAVGSKAGDLAGWLRDEFFKDHCRLFHNRPFVWHLWDGRRDGFSALVNYHRLNRKGLERLTYTALGWWIDRHRADVDEGVAGADSRLVAAQDLQRRLTLILEGEPPYDIYVRWKSRAEQPLGWDPDLDDGVRLNIRPFVEAGVLRSKFSINWRKDRGTDPGRSERHNDQHLTLAEKRAARTEGGRTG
jgi:hypothetical protein